MTTESVDLARVVEALEALRREVARLGEVLARVLRLDDVIHETPAAGHVR